MQQAIRGMLAGLDPHSEYLDQHAMEQLTEDTSGSYEGLGLEVLATDGSMRGVTASDAAPAERAGVKPGDVITRINDTVITAENVNESVSLLRGKPGSEV